MPFRFLIAVFIFLSSIASAQDYTTVVRHRPVLWTEMDLVYRTRGRWSFQLDNIYRRQADDSNGSDLNILRYPLQQAFRPWVTYQLSKPVRVSLSPISLWWAWNQTSKSPLTIQRNIRFIPQILLTQPVGRSELVLRFRSEFRWSSVADTLRHPYDVLTDDLPPFTRRDVRHRLLLRWVQPLSRQGPPAESGFVQGSIEPLAYLSSRDTRLDQLQSSIIFGKRLSENYRLSIGYQNILTIRKNDAAHIRSLQYTHALTCTISIGNQLQKRPGTNPVSQ
ncbi:DUF2490 domain-containing protein [Spirosoma taeanense]|uniref:DUF2490 domain-containing protein n=1 Tax=Spirosoma taeanense TaxID=2735870 RepID=A0A6M5Y8L5_9BACT|nr:DUF2490 domain-containing protein [Spirosoma taeanense]QJW89591.1 DUF2490 domain-containing protein [Spirosoma taeanense]